MDKRAKLEYDLRKMIGEVDFSAYPNRIIIPGVAIDKNAIYGERYVEYRRQWAENPIRHELSDFPLHIDIEPSNMCNLRCPMCYRNVFKQKNEEHISEEVFTKIVDECVDNNIPSIKFVGRGEVLMHPRIVEMVAEVKSRGIMDTHMTTNAALLNEKISEGLIDAGIDNIIISVDGVNKETYESVRIGAIYEDVVANITRLMEIKKEKGRELPFIQVQIVCMKSTLDEVVEFVKMWRDRGVNRIDLIRYKNPKGRDGDPHRLATRPDQKCACKQLWQRLQIFYDGTASMCCGDYEPKNDIGNVHEVSIKEIWNGDLISRIRNLHLDKRWEEVTPCDVCEINAKVSDDSEWDWLVEQCECQEVVV